MKNGDIMQFNSVKLNKNYVNQLIELSQLWEMEKCTHGIIANKEEDLSEPLFVALENEKVVGYLFGRYYVEEEKRSYVEKGSRCFSVDEFYVLPAYRNRGIGKQLYRLMESEVMGKCAYITLATSSKDYKAILKLYVEELGMDFHSEFLIKKI